ncbi:hypothetical protein [Nocardia sp. NPDC057455]|uniref:hypothetical protein n=1 Tax=Nocardia sp. NPDC057455 TaxID=3346138 RepID=UPI00366EB0C8
MTNWTGTGAHRTRTIEWQEGERYKTKSNGSCGRYVAVMAAKAECTCGWSKRGEDRADARWRARAHRATIAVATKDLAALVMLMSEHAIPFSLFPALRNLDDVARAAGDDATVQPHLADLRPILQQANRPWLYIEHPYIPRLIAAVEQADRWEPVGMIDSAKGWCERLASAHGVEFDQWLRKVTPEVDAA